MKMLILSRLIISAIIITLIQLVSFGHLYYIHEYRSGQFPADFIELNILAICNIGVLILSYFKIDKKLNIWLVPVSLSVITISTLLVLYIFMWINKYK